LIASGFLDVNALSQDMRQPMTFTCKRCGNCCKKIGIPWSELDPRLAADYLDVTLDDFIARYGFVRNEYSGEIENTEFNAAPCPFLKCSMKHAYCRIYPVRPWICKDYPGTGTQCISGQKRS
jgi:Fe-S-cluster containining protein